MNRVAHVHPFFLVSIGMEQARAVQIQCVAFAPCRQPLQAPAPQPTEALAIVRRAFKALEETREGRLAADAFNAQQIRQQWVSAQIRDLSQFLGSGQDAGDEAQAQILRRNGIGAGALRQTTLEQRSKAMPMQKTGKWAKPGMGRYFLCREPDLNCFLTVVNFNNFGHCLGSRYVGVLGCFLMHKSQAHLRQ
jgi:hypothetical protein